MSDEKRFRCTAAVSTSADTAEAAHDVCRQVKEQLGTPPDLAVVFASINHQADFVSLATALNNGLRARCLLGCTGESIACGAREYENTSALALWAAALPGVHLTPIHLEFEQTGDGGAFVGWPDELTESWPHESSLLMLAEPFSFPADALLQQINHDRPGVNVIGGMASGGWSPGQNGLLLGPRGIEHGAVAVVIDGPIRVRTVVSQGCRPVGRPFVVTKAQQNVIFELGGQAALKQCQDVLENCTAEEQQLARQGLHVGLVINEYQETFDRGDFLIRNVQGADRDSGAIAIGDYARVGQTVQLHVRDAQTADEELHALLASAGRANDGNALGALMFTCNGRGSRLFSEPNHDAAAIAQHWPNLPLAGFFAQGEIGPVGGKNFLHGFTASVALFEPASPVDER